jgi:YD repeat-containing protein
MNMRIAQRAVEGEAQRLDALRVALYYLRREARAADLVTNYVWSPSGRLLSVTDPEGIETRYGYDLRGRLETMTADYGGLNRSTIWGLDGYGNVTSVTDPAGAVTSHVYNEQNFLTKITDAEGYDTRLTLDGAGRVLRMEREREQDGAVYGVANQYDAINRLLSQVVDPDAGGLNVSTFYQYTPTAGCGSCSGATPGSARPNSSLTRGGNTRTSITTC